MIEKQLPVESSVLQIEIHSSSFDSRNFTRKLFKAEKDQIDNKNEKL
jgi:hypothetical protein